MKILTLEQGSESWLIWRKTHITATDASVILGKNPYKTAHELWEEKLGIRPGVTQTPAMERGTRLEPEARNIACEVLEIDFFPAVVESEENPWMVASLDGLSPCHEYILEIKCPNVGTHAFSLQDGIHFYYHAQMQHQLAVTGAKKCYYMSYRPEHETKYKIIEVLPDLEYIQEMIETEHRFYIENLCQMKEPYQLRYEGH